ncbi:MAG: N-acetylglucosamine-6-phosphate deacetylase [bacterium]
MQTSYLAIINGCIITPLNIIDGGTIIIKNRRILRIGPTSKIAIPRSAKIIDARLRWVVPGYIDLHLQGAFGHDVWDEDTSSLPALCNKLIAAGTTGFLATTEFHIPTIKRLREFMECGLRIADCGIKNSKSEIINLQSTMLGIHLEGPFINPDRKGGIPVESIHKPSRFLLSKIFSLADQYLKMMTLAPELKNSVPLVRDLVSHRVIAAIGHTAATFAEAKRGFDAGISHTTHIFNQITPIHHRNPGATLASLLDDRITVQVICDGIHLDWEIIKLIYKLKGPKKIALITDAVKPAGLPDGIYYSQGHGRKSIVKNGKVTRPDGTIAGSTLTMDRAVANAVKYAKIPFVDAIQMATLTPASILGISHQVGTIAPNKIANLVILDNQYRVTQTVINGVLFRAGKNRRF